MPKIPKSFDQMLAAWNESDPKKMRRHLDKALAKGVEFTDPNYAIEGVPAFAKMVKDFRKQYPAAQCIRTSGIDMHHDRARYSWAVILNEDTRLDGYDTVAVTKKARKIKRVDGFFGPLPPE